VVIHKDHQVYIPELIFGQLLTSSNYNDSQQRIVGGLNGMGGNLANIYSKFFSIETIDSERELYYYQEFSDNMYKKTKPIIKKSKKKSYTKITFIPDYRRFHMSGMTSDVLGVIKKRTYDTSATTGKDISVYFNDIKLPYKDFQQYIQLYVPDDNEEKFIYEKYVKDDYIWEYAVIYNPEANHTQVSFVNGIATTQGGRHVEFILNQIIKKLSDLLISKKKIENIKSSYIKDRLNIFIRATIDKPSFSGQTKEFLSTAVAKFGSKPEVSDAFVNKIYSKTGIVEDLVSFTKYRNQKDLEKTVEVSSRKKARINIPKLEDAHNAGTSKSEKTVLFLTEGDSAKTFALSGLSVIGRDNYGIFPLKGKLLNIREATQKQLVGNEEINNLKQIIGLQHGKKYTDVKSLRYGSVCILTDADFDGVHIKALLVNMFHVWWPELLEIKGFLISMKTPMIKVSKGTQEVPFYTVKDYNEWLSNTENSSRWHTKYYKGLGTSTAKEAKSIFKNMKENLISYFSSTKSGTDSAIVLAFDKKKADDRKRWLQKYNFNMTLDQASTDVTYPDLINKELIHFSMYDVLRSIPSLCDGLKPSQRKVIFGMFKRNFSQEIKVAQLGAVVSELTAYHHGETSLFGTIINMAQDYPGSNNINLLNPNGQFGSRTQSGKDAASPRYIFTELSEITKNIYNKDDFEIIDYLEDDGQKIEPKFYIPILPMVLINGAQGIGTGYSTNIPLFNPKDIIANMELLLKKERPIPMTPWYRGYTGKIVRDSDDNFVIHGIYNVESDTVLRITEIPIGTAIEDYKEFLEKLLEAGTLDLKTVENNSTENIPDFKLKFNKAESLKKFLETDVYKHLKLTKGISTKNYHLLDQNGVITKYRDAEEILTKFMKIRIEYTRKRKEYLLKKYNEELVVLENKIRFLTEIMENKLVVYRKSKDELEKMLLSSGYQKVTDYSYLTSMPIYSFTKEKLSDLNKRFDSVKELYDTTNIKSSTQILSEDLSEISKKI
jgi:DNA topoisomerase-2